jgi:hypothetical protein
MAEPGRTPPQLPKRRFAGVDSENDLDRARLRALNLLILRVL